MTESSSEYSDENRDKASHGEGKDCPNSDKKRDGDYNRKENSKKDKVDSDASQNDNIKKSSLNM